MSLATLSDASASRSFEQSVLPLRTSLFAAALGLSGSRAEADDLVQETVLRAWRFWSRYEERESCRAWLHRILRNVFISRRRKQRREQQLLLRRHEQLQSAEVYAAAPEPVRAGRDDLRDEILGCLDALRQEHRAVVWLVDVQAKSYREAADALGWPIGTVMSRLHRARRLLRADVSELAAA